MNITSWKIALCVLCLLPLRGQAAEPVAESWIVSPAAANAPLARVQTEVRAVNVRERHVEIQSGGISLYSLGALQTPRDHVERWRQLRFLIPRFPALAKSEHVSVRPDVVGAFLNGVPIYRQFDSDSYQNQNLWHFDPLAAGDSGARVANGYSKDDSHRTLDLGLLENLIADNTKHSPLLGYALDGFPIYGPWTYANVAANSLRRMRSSYRLRRLERRTTWPDGTQLTPSQYGPPVNADYPLGAFVEDYEYVAGAGELDEFNGRFAVTPEYPQGTYAYFLTTDEYGRLAFPYLLAGRYAGQITRDELQPAFRDDAVPEEILTGGKPLLAFSKAQLALNVYGENLRAGQPLRLSFTVRPAPVRFLEYVHERPLHLLVVSEDLSEFAHIHPVLTAGDHYEVRHSFAHSGRWRLYADFTPPGGAQRIERFTFTLPGKAPTIALKPDHPVGQAAHSPSRLVKEQAGLNLNLSHQQPLRAGEDIEFAFTIRDAKTGQSISDHEPYLGAWAHFVVIDQKHEHFVHAHPLESVGQVTTLSHPHATASLGPPPGTIRTMVNFPQPGLYQLWAQFQRNGTVITQPFVLSISAAHASSKFQAIAIPPGALRLELNSQGFSPARLTWPINQPVALAITTRQRPACVQRIHFASLGLTRDLPVNGTILLELPALPASEISFRCGMGMYQGLLVVQ